MMELEEFGGYAESIIRNPADYDALEVHGVRDLMPAHQKDMGNSYNADRDGTMCEVDDDSPEFFSVYAHLAQNGVECIGDFPTLALAIVYAKTISAQYRWPVYVYSDSVNEPEQLPTEEDEEEESREQDARIHQTGRR